MKCLIYLAPLVVAALLLPVRNASAQFTLVYMGSGIITNDSGDIARGVAVSGDWAYLANNEDGLRVFDVSDHTQPQAVGHVANPFSVGSYDVCVAGRYAYLANGFDGLRIFDISSPTNVANVGHSYPGGFALGVTVRGNYAYLPSSEGGLIILDISNPTNPVPIAQTNNGGNAYRVALSGQYAYLANNNDGLRVYDISNPSNPINVGYTNINPYVSTAAWPVDIEISGHYAFVAHESWGIQIYDLSNPTTPVWTNGISFGGNSASVAVCENGRYAFAGCYSCGLRMLDVSDLSNIRVVDVRYDSEYNYGITVQGNYVYVADGFNGLRIYLAQPQLSVSMTSSNTVLISWPQPIASGPVLEQSASLSAGNWLTMTNEPTVINGQNQVIVSPSAFQGFFRLSFPN